MATIALTLIATKTTEKVGEKLGEGGIVSTKNLLDVLRRKSPDTAKQLESSNANPPTLDFSLRLPKSDL